MANKERPSVTIKGNVSGANVNFGEQDFQGAVTFTFSGAPAASQDVQVQLQTLYHQLADALAQAPAEQARDVSEVWLRNPVMNSVSRRWNCCYTA